MMNQRDHRPTSSYSKILWTVDAFDERSLAHSHMSSLLKIFGKKIGAQIQPVFVLSRDQTNLPSQLFSKWAEDYAQEAREILVKRIHIDPGKGMLEPIVLLEKDGSTRSSISRLLSFASQHAFDLIATATHARQGVSRLFLGSFAETLLLNSSLPLLVSNPSVGHGHSIRRMIAAVKLPFKSITRWNEITHLATLLECDLRVFYHQLRPLRRLSNRDQRSIEEELSRQERMVQAETASLLENARKQGARTDLSITNNADLVDAILSQVSDPKHDLLVIFGERKDRESRDCGRTVRQVIRQISGTVLFLPM